jgi:hypothetical protein
MMSVSFGDDNGAGVDLRSAIASPPIPQSSHGKGPTVMAMDKEWDLFPLPVLHS